jgi:transcriptional regulator with XRE-family HTH domain
MILKDAEKSNRITSPQIRAARALLGWSGNELARLSGVGLATIRRYEKEDGLMAANPNVLQAIKNIFEEAGIEFTGDPLVNPGVILHLDHKRKL